MIEVANNRRRRVVKGRLLHIISPISLGQSSGSLETPGTTEIDIGEGSNKRE